MKRTYLAKSLRLALALLLVFCLVSCDEETVPDEYREEFEAKQEKNEPTAEANEEIVIEQEPLAKSDPTPTPSAEPTPTEPTPTPEESEEKPEEKPTYSDTLKQLIDAGILTLSYEIKEAEKKEFPAVAANVECLLFDYDAQTKTYVITGCADLPTSLSIPSSLGGKSVREIADRAFYYQALEYVAIADGVESIGWFAFHCCPNLHAVLIPESVTYIGYAAFDLAAEDFTVFCYENSYAHRYAKSFGLAFEIIG